MLDTASGRLHCRCVVDLDRYFARIGYRGPLTATLETLNGVLCAHVEAIPFENLDVLLGRPIDLAIDAVQRKLVDDRRGGYCFEHGTLLLAVLGQLGFTVRPLSGRVRYGRPRDYTPPRTHLMIRVELDESWLVDPGNGNLSLTQAIRIATEEPQPTGHETRRLVRENGVIYHQAWFAGAWNDVCELTLEEMPEIDRVVGNWYTSMHPATTFKQRLTAARALPQGRRVTVLNRELTLRARDGSAERRTLDTPDELLAVLADHFGLIFPAGTRFPCPALDWPAE